MIKAKKTPIFPTYKFHDENEALGTLKASLIKPAATFSGKEGDFTFFREKQFEGTYFLSSAGYSSLAQAHKPNGIGLKYKVDFDKQEYDLNPGTLFHDRLYLHYEVYKNDELLGILMRDTSLFKYLIDIKAELPPIVQIFLFWLSLSAWIGESGWRCAWLYR